MIKKIFINPQIISTEILVALHEYLMVNIPILHTLNY